MTLPGIQTHDILLVVDLNVSTSLTAMSISSRSQQNSQSQVHKEHLGDFAKAAGGVIHIGSLNDVGVSRPAPALPQFHYFTFAVSETLLFDFNDYRDRF